MPSSPLGVYKPLIVYKARDWLIANYFPAHCFYGYNKHLFSPQELSECMPCPSGAVYIIVTYGHEPYKEGLYHWHINMADWHE